MQQAIFGGGCFWCTEAVFLQLRGVAKVVSGYAGGQMDNPNYSYKIEYYIKLPDGNINFCVCCPHNVHKAHMNNYS